MGGVAPSAGSKVLSGGRRRCDWSSLCASWARPLLKQWQMILDCRIGANIEGIKKASARAVLRGCGLNAGPRPNVSIRSMRARWRQKRGRRPAHWLPVYPATNRVDQLEVQNPESGSPSRRRMCRARSWASSISASSSMVRTFRPRISQRPADMTDSTFSVFNELTNPACAS